jgi:hypothetical protein
MTTTQWSVAHILATYTDEALVYHLIAHMFRIATCTNGASCTPNEKWSFHTYENSEIDKCIAEQQSSYGKKGPRWGIYQAKKLWESRKKVECIEHLLDSAQKLSAMAVEVESW